MSMYNTNTLFRNMHAGKISREDVVAAPVADVWEIYRGFELARCMNQYLSQVIGVFDFVEGDGEVGSLIRLTLPPGTPGFTSIIEKFIVMDDEKREKVLETIEGGYLALGFSSFRAHLVITEKSPESTIIKSTIEYEIDEKLADNVSFVSLDILKIMAQTVEKHLLANKASA